MTTRDKLLASISDPISKIMALAEREKSRQFAQRERLPSSLNPANVVQLPLWPEPVRGLPNAILRTALFAAIKRGKRRYMERESVASIKGIEVRYTGQQLNQSDLDVWEGALHIARLQPLGNQIEFTEKGFLKMIGRGGQSGKSIGKSDREWLRKTFARLSANTIEVKNGFYTYGGSLIDEYFRNESNGHYVLVFNPHIKILFRHGGWTQIDRDIRLSLRGHPLAQWLHVFYSSHAKPFPISYEKLHELCGSESGAKAKTKSELNKALLGWKDDSLTPALNLLADNLEQWGQAFSWELNNSLVYVDRTPSNTQKRHLRKKVAISRSKTNRSYR